MTALHLTAVSYSVDGAVAATGVGKTKITAAMKSGDLIAHYVGIKPLIRAVDLDEWIASLPTESPRRSA